MKLCLELIVSSYVYLYKMCLHVHKVFKGWYCATFSILCEGDNTEHYRYQVLQLLEIPYKCSIVHNAF